MIYLKESPRILSYEIIETTTIVRLICA